MSKRMVESNFWPTSPEIEEILPESSEAII